MSSSDLDALVQEAALAHQAGRLQAAIAGYRRVTASVPNHPVANHNLGVLAIQTGHGVPAALPFFVAAWEADPTHEQHWQSLVRALSQTGNVEAARGVYRDGVQRGLRGPSPDELQRRAAAPSAVTLPATPEAALGDLKAAVGRRDWPRAQALAEAICTRWPERPASWQGAWRAFVAAEMWPQAVLAAQHWHQRSADDGEALRALAIASARCARQGEAEQAAAAALAITGPDAELERLRGEALLALARDDEAEAALRRSLALEPAHEATLRSLGGLLLRRQDMAGMLALARDVVGRLPHRSEAWADLGRVQMRAGDLAAARESFQRARTLAPRDAGVLRDWLFCSNYLGDMPDADRLVAARRFGELLREGVRPFRHQGRERRERLRIGLVSGDLHTHPVAYFLEPLLRHADPARVSWHLYACRAVEDAWTARLRAGATQWRVVAGMAPAQLAEQIHGDGIDVLVDLAGHTADSGLAAFAWRPAPLQLAWLGYFATTGLSEIDAVLADAASVPAEDNRAFVERVVHLPTTRLCFAPPDDAPAVALLPALERGHVTFGCFQALAKINDRVLAAWARILARADGARLRVQCPEFSQEETRVAFAARAAAAGIGPARLDTRPPGDRATYLQNHAEVDLILDTFPYPGGTTTCEALWMGVPTVTLSSPSMIGRQGAALLTAAGLGDWVCTEVSAYEDIAVARASDLAALAALRGRLRAEMAASALFDGPRFARDWLETVHGLWHEPVSG